MEYYLTLLRESMEKLIEMRMVSDPSVADFILQIEIAVQFIYKALKTEDRMDIYRALQKAYNVLEIEHGAESGDADYDLLVEKLKQALKRLQQQDEGIIKKSTLKALTKMVLDEIFLPPSKVELAKQVALQVFHQSIERNKPAYLKTTQNGHKQAYIVLKNLVTNFKDLVKACLKKDEKKITKIKKQVLYNGEWLVDFFMHWAKAIQDEDPTQSKNLDAVVESFREHFNVMSVQGRNMLDSIKLYKNYINASKESERVNESLKGMREAIDNLFQIGIDIGYDAKQQAKQQVAFDKKQAAGSGKKREIFWPAIPFTFDTLIEQNPKISKMVLRKELEISLRNKTIYIKGMVMSPGHSKPVLIFMKRQQ